MLGPKMCVRVHAVGFASISYDMFLNTLNCRATPFNLDLMVVVFIDIELTVAFISITLLSLIAGMVFATQY